MSNDSSVFSDDFELLAISPLDGRYASYVKELRYICSEYGLMKNRVSVELRWLKFLSCSDEIKEIKPLSSFCKGQIDRIIDCFDPEMCKNIKKNEHHVRHDVKAVELYIREQFFKTSKLADYESFIHICCTSEDINSVAYGMMFKDARDLILLKNMNLINDNLLVLAKKYLDTPMLSRTHGQIASPTSFGKEILNFSYRLKMQVDAFKKIKIFAKFNGAVGNYNAHYAAFPEVDWWNLSKEFIRTFGLEINPFTTQIEPHDWLSEFLQCLIRFNVIAIDLCRDIWGYISLGYLRQKNVLDEVGSSTMPHKINPIDFENAEGNLGIANALAQHCVVKLPVSRFQRDLSDSTVLRSISSIMAYSLLAYKSINNGLSKVSVNKKLLEIDLDSHWEVLSEAIQTVMRKHGISNGYDLFKNFTKGKKLNKESFLEFVKEINLPEDEMLNLLNLTPNKYLGKINWSVLLDNPE